MVGRIYKLKHARKQKYWRCSKVGAECTACSQIKKAEGCRIKRTEKFRAGIDRKDHVENCRVDEHLAYID
ncbi:hypothetical protein T08_12290 [Trichinella sp. T8]|nr:hypothetical protein T08_12290 [Trichinella sp. T8]